MAKTTYCANCDAEAVVTVIDTDTPLCHTCKTAYQWGQESPDGDIEDL